ncbi:MAG: hypothetical protein CBD60_01575 [Flavobacteriaceae bacterium TMED200]|nr:hypothetical protein [Flavobacteriaceae bacterium]OUW66500.1 MAG: hypothetical protein CBD60_01575 [Flavobacteriaceae bacterium TMED200]|tara:strand:+ start:698 stop:1423 length:726 start_codon:yes stop_codon:yes gene_type:complete
MKYIITFFLISNIIFSQDKKIRDQSEIWEPEVKIVDPYEFDGVPGDAIILFDGSDFSKWKSERNNQEVKWFLNSDKSMTIRPGTGGIQTAEEHGSIQLHIEWKSPTKIIGDGQYRGNSGIFFQRRYELQILDSYQNRTYSNGQAGSIYKQHIPLVNVSLPPGKWQKFDVVFNAPEFNNEGDEIKKGNFTIFHNGVLIHNAIEISSATYDFEKNTPFTLLLQDHGKDEGNYISFRNIWMRKL